MAVSNTFPQASAGAVPASETLLQVFWRRFRRNRMAVVGLVLVGAFLVVAVAAPWIAPYHYNDQNLPNAWQAPSLAHPFGTDDLGRDQLSRVIYAIRIAAIVGVGASMLSLLIGAVIGAISGMRGGWVDSVLMRVVDIFNSFPSILLAVVLAAALGQSVGIIIVALAVTGWAGYARLVRGQVLAIKNNEYVLAARTLGAGEGYLIRKYVLPNILGPIIVALSFGIPYAMTAEAGLSVIGVGIRPPEPSWGNLINLGLAKMRGFPHLAIWPTAIFSLTLLAFTWFGDGLQEIFNPKGER
ncbi:ABC transporter permease [Kallotenue papyrolyticum]|uniref:ABC transporter permease n=1 Tax=Kallotenue papyrolyticum TaxID=1325125 RepID=UPI0004786004|nr:ABC transporter permease [Kallotenue papyrolyticum]